MVQMVFMEIVWASENEFVLGFFQLYPFIQFTFSNLLFPNIIFFGNPGSLYQNETPFHGTQTYRGNTP